MSKIHTTLHKKGDSSVEIYPNIESENIPSDAITTAKILDGSITSSKIANASVTTSKIDSNAVTSGKLATSSVTTDKINNGAVTTSKLANLSVDNSKIADGSISSAKIQNNAITYNKLGSDITALFDKINKTYGLFVGEDVSGLIVATMYFGNTTLSSLWNNYSDAEINDALNFDKSQNDYTNTNLDIIALIIDGIYETDVINGNYTNVKYGDIQIIIRKDTLTSTYSIHYLENDVTKFQLSYILNTHTISDYINTKTIHFTLKKSIV